MSQLPNHKVPRLGTTGEKYRERNLVHQLPAQDLALTHCRHVAPEQQRAFRDFVQARNDIALDVGFVRELNHSSVSGRTPYGREVLLKNVTLRFTGKDLVRLL